MQTLIGPEYPREVIKMIAAARSTIDIISYDWRWYGDKPAHKTQQLNIAIVNAVKRGVRVRAVLNVADQALFLSTLGIKAKQLKDKRVLHAKLLIVDGTQAVIGSHNLTSNAFNRNLECSIVVEINEPDHRLRTFFENLYSM